MRLNGAWLLLTCIVGLCGTPVLSQGDTEPAPTFMDMYVSLKEKVLGKPNVIAFDIPECLVTLEGGINGIEEIIADSIKLGEKWMILITSSNDRTSLPATEQFYKAASKVCPPESASLIEKVVHSEDSFDDDAREDETLDLEAVQGWRFAQMSFDKEPGMIWRWWIWKVPIVVIVTPPTSDTRDSDIRFWKIAFSLPRADRILEVISNEDWKRLEVWDSYLSPSGVLAFAPYHLSSGFGVLYNIFDPLPSWLLTILATAGGSILVNFLHSNSATNNAAAASAGPTS